MKIGKRRIALREKKRGAKRGKKRGAKRGERREAKRGKKRGAKRGKKREAKREKRRERKKGRDAERGKEDVVDPNLARRRREKTHGSRTRKRITSRKKPCTSLPSVFGRSKLTSMNYTTQRILFTSP